MNTSESFQDNGNLWLAVEIIHDDETQVNEFQRKQLRNKKFQLVIFGDSITKRIDPSFIERSDKSLAFNYSAWGAKVPGVYEQMRTFRENHQEGALPNIIIHFGRSHLPRDFPSDTTANYYYMQQKNFQIDGFTFTQSHLNSTTHFLK